MGIPARRDCPCGSFTVELTAWANELPILQIGQKLFRKDSLMATQKDLYLHEEIMLLTLCDEEGTIASGTMYQYAIGAAVLAIQVMQAAVMVACIMPTIMTTTIHH